MGEKRHGSDEIVVGDSRPLVTVYVGLVGLILASWIIRRPLVGVPLAVGCVSLMVVARRRPPHNPTIANANGIAGLRLRVPRAHRGSWFIRHEVVRSVTPWNQIETLRVAASPLSGTRIRVHLADGREADLGAGAITGRGA